MLLWPFNKYPGTDYETFNWEWILKTVKDYTKKVDDFIADMTAAWNAYKAAMAAAWNAYKANLNQTWNTYKANLTQTWNDFRDWTTGEINQMHDDFAQYVNVTEGALNTGAIADGAITWPKLNSDIKWYTTPEAFGAIGDGQTDDTTAVQTALNTGLPVIGRQTYNVNEIHVYNYLAGHFKAHIVHLHDNSTIEGVYENNTRETETINPVVNVEGSNILIDNCMFKGEHKGSAINIATGLNNIHIANSIFDPSFKNDIYLRGDDVLIENCLFKEHTSNTTSPISEYGNAIKVTGTELQNYEDNGRNIKIVHNTIYDHGDNCIDLYTGAESVIVESNYLYNKTQIAIEDKLSGTESVDANNIKHIYANNIIKAVGGYRISSVDYGSGLKPAIIEISGGIVDAIGLSSSVAMIYALNTPDINIRGGIYKTTNAFIDVTGTNAIIDGAIIDCDVVMMNPHDETKVMFSNSKITLTNRFSSVTLTDLIIENCIIDGSANTAPMFPLTDTAKSLTIIGCNIKSANNFIILAAVPIMLLNNTIDTGSVDNCIYNTSSNAHKEIIAKNNYLKNATKILRTAITASEIIIADNVTLAA